MGFVGNYAPWGLSPQTDGMPVIPEKPRKPYGSGAILCLDIVLLYIRSALPRFRYASSRSGHSPYRPFAKYPNENKLSPDICLMPALLIA